VLVGRVDHGFEQLRDDLLRVREARAVEFHEPRVAADVGDQQEGGLDGHRMLGRAATGLIRGTQAGGCNDGQPCCSTTVLSTVKP
jgi:hypothetical protein